MTTWYQRTAQAAIFALLFNTVACGLPGVIPARAENIEYPGGILRMDPIAGNGNSFYPNANSNNYVIVSGIIPNRVYGGLYIPEGALGFNGSNYNRVWIKGSAQIGPNSGDTTPLNVFGGYTLNEFNGSGGYSYYGAGGASFNEVYIGDNAITGGVVGGYSKNGRTSSSTEVDTFANNNSVVITDDASVTGNIYGGAVVNDSSNKSNKAEFNSVEINGNAHVEGDIAGGRASGYDDTASNNIVIIHGDANVTTKTTGFSDGIAGGFAVVGQANENIVYIGGNAVINLTSKGIIGGVGGELPSDNDNPEISVIDTASQAAGGGDAERNIVIVTGNAVITGAGGYHAAIAGGSSNFGSANGNYVYIDENATINGAVYGGYSATGNATYNMVTIAGSPNLGSAGLFGGNNGSGDSFTGNTLNVYGFSGNASSVNNFENYDFILPSSLGKDESLLSVGSWANSSASAITVQGVNIEGGGAALGVGDMVRLIDSDGAIPANGVNGTISGMKGTSLLYNFNLNMDTGINALTATVDSVSAHPQTKAFSEGRAAGMGFLNQGSDLAADKGMNNAFNQTGQTGGSPAVFGAMSYGSSRYETGSHADVNAFSLLAGVASRSNSEKGSLLKGIFLEGGWGNYNAYNSFTNAPSVKSSGDVSYFGIGALIRRDMSSGSYLEGSLRGGKSKTTFGSGDFEGQSQNVSYTSKPTYYGAHLGVGHLKKIGAKTVDYYAKYFWTHQNGDDVNVAGDPVHFSSSDSSRLRGGVRFGQTRPDGRIATYAGLAYEHEFDGKAKATVYGHDIDAPSLRGGTGIVELGVSWKKSAESNNSLHLGLQGYVGQRKGLSGNVQFRKMF